MAYLQDIRVPRCHRCEKTNAKHRLITCRNDVYGEYCSPCARKMLATVQEDEKRLHDQARVQR